MSVRAPLPTRATVSYPRLAPLRARPEASALLFDVDGTLAPIVERPADARVPGDVRDLVARLDRDYALVACVSGRRAADARRVVGLDHLTYVGNHGYELLAPNGTDPELNPAAAERASRPAAFLAELDWAELERLGVRAEDKGPIQALHWRGATDEAGAEAAVREIGGRAQAAGLVPRWGRKVLELRPVAGVDKGSAVHRLLVERAPLAAALYAGDDRTDLDAFRALRGLERSGRIGAAVCVGVSSEEGPEEIVAEADVVLAGPEALPELLRELAG